MHVIQSLFTHANPITTFRALRFMHREVSDHARQCTRILSNLHEEGYIKITEYYLSLFKIHVHRYHHFRNQ